MKACIDRKQKSEEIPVSKVSNMLKLIQILKDGNVHSIVSLANTIEVSDRMIRQYKLELEQAGIYIKSITGKYGGL